MLTVLLGTRKALFSCLPMVLVFWAIGCGYSVRPPYDRSIRTVYVPMFRSYSFRIDQNQELHERVVKEIERRTPYRVVDTPEEADTILSGTILYTNKNLFVVNPNNLPRQILGDVTAEVTWEDIRPGTDPNEDPPVARVTEMISFFPELGETASLGFSKAYERMANDIVDMMEERW